MVRSGKWATTSLTLRTRRRPNNKQKARTDTTDVSLHKFVDILKEFKFVPYPEYRRKQAKNQPTEDYYFLARQISDLLKSNHRVLLHNQRVKSEVVLNENVKKPGTKHINEKIQFGITSTIEKYWRVSI